MAHVAILTRRQRRAGAATPALGLRSPAQSPLLTCPHQALGGGTCLVERVSGRRVHAVGAPGKKGERALDEPESPNRERAPEQPRIVEQRGDERRAEREAELDAE